MLETAVKYIRTDAERADQRLSWNRSDRAFFAAGACHILAYAFVVSEYGDGFTPKLVKPADGGSMGIHVIATRDGVAFDFNGLCSETELLDANRTAMRLFGFERG